MIRQVDLLDKNGLADSEAKWQKHVVVTLWVVLVCFIVLGVALMYGKAHGLFQSGRENTTPSWPVDWP